MENGRSLSIYIDPYSLLAWASQPASQPADLIAISLKRRLDQDRTPHRAPKLRVVLACIFALLLAAAAVWSELSFAFGVINYRSILSRGGEERKKLMVLVNKWQKKENKSTVCIMHTPKVQKYNHQKQSSFFGAHQQSGMDDKEKRRRRHPSNQPQRWKSLNGLFFSPQCAPWLRFFSFSLFFDGNSSHTHIVQ